MPGTSGECGGSGLYSGSWLETFTSSGWKGVSLLTSKLEQLPSAEAPCVHGWMTGMQSKESVVHSFKAMVFSLKRKDILTAAATWMNPEVTLLGDRSQPIVFLQLVRVVIVVVQLLNHVQPFVTPRTPAHRASLSFTLSWSCSESCPLSQLAHITL